MVSEEISVQSRLAWSMKQSPASLRSVAKGKTRRLVGFQTCVGFESLPDHDVRLKWYRLSVNS